MLTELLCVLALTAIVIGIAGLILAWVALGKTSGSARQVADLVQRVARLSVRVFELERTPRSGPGDAAGHAQPAAPEPGPVPAPPPVEPLRPAPMPPLAPSGMPQPKPVTAMPEEEEVEISEDALVDEPVAAAATGAPLGPSPARPEPPRVDFVLEPTPTDAEQWAKWEDIIGKQWMTWIGAAVVFLGAGFFVKYAFEQGWLNEKARVCVGIAFGAVLMAAGDRFLRRTMRALGQGLMGAGLAIVYLSLFASHGIYDLISPTTAFIFMVVACAVGMTLAVRHDSMSISILATLGGFFTPILVSTGKDARDVLFTYLTLLNLGVMGVALFKRWLKLNSIALVGTWLLFAGWYGKFYNASAMGPTLFWLGVFYFTFLVLPFVYHFRHGAASSVGQFVLSLVHAAVAFAYLWRVLGGLEGHHHVLGGCALGMSACYLGMGAAFRKRVPSDERALFGFITLSVVFLTLAAPLHLGLHGITWAWALEAPALAYLGYRYRYRPVRIGGFILLTLTMARIVARHWPLHDAASTFLFNANFGTVSCLPFCAWAYAVIHHWQREHATPEDRILKLTSAIGAGFAALVLLHAEVWQWFDFGARRDLAMCVVSALWAAGALAFLAAGLRLRCVPSRVSGFAALTVALTLGATLQAVDMKGTYWLFLSPRFLTSLFVVATVFGFAYLYRWFSHLCTEAELSLAPYVAVAAGFFCLSILSVDIQDVCLRGASEAARARWVAHTTVTMLWAVGTAAFLAVGLCVRSIQARVGGLIALAVSGIMVLHLHVLSDAPDCWLFASPRFLAAMMVVAAASAYAVMLRRCDEICIADEQQVARFMGWAALLLLLLNMSVEVHSYFSRVVEDRARARWIAQMSLSILWGAYASVLLAIGFWRRVRPLRFVALGLFGFTALKLVFVDMATVKQVYRIIAFMVMGGLMFGASYLYHRLEKLLTDQRQEAG